MKVDVNELDFIRRNAPKGLYSIVADNLSARGIPTTRFKVHQQVSVLKDEFDEIIISEIRTVLAQVKQGLTYEKAIA